MSEHLAVHFPDGTTQQVRVVAWETDDGYPGGRIPMFAIDLPVEAAFGPNGLTYHAIEVQST